MRKCPTTVSPLLIVEYKRICCPVHPAPRNMSKLLALYVIRPPSPMPSLASSPVSRPCYVYCIYLSRLNYFVFSSWYMPSFFVFSKGSTVLRRSRRHALCGKSCRGGVELDEASFAPLQGEALFRSVCLWRNTFGVDKHDCRLQVQAGGRGELTGGVVAPGPWWQNMARKLLSPG